MTPAISPRGYFSVRRAGRNSPACQALSVDLRASQHVYWRATCKPRGRASGPPSGSRLSLAAFSPFHSGVGSYRAFQPTMDNRASAIPHRRKRCLNARTGRTMKTMTNIHYDSCPLQYE